MKNYFIDTHAHLDFPSFDHDRDTVINTYQKEMVKKIINVAVSLETIDTSQSLAEKHPHIYTSLGLHPTEITLFETFSETEIFNLMLSKCNRKKIVAIGECGLDYFKIQGQKDKQKRLFIIMIKLAQQLKLPLIIHSRDAFDDIINILEEQKFSFEKILFHSWSYGLKEAREVIKRNSYFSFNGIVTYKNAQNVQEVATMVSQNKFFLETDSPFLPPQGKRGERNDPSNIPLIAKQIATLRKTDIETIANLTTSNAELFFDLAN